MQRHKRLWVALLAALMTIAPAGCGGSDERLPPTAASKLQLPGGDLVLANLCASAETDERTVRQLRRKAASLLAELSRRPDHELTIVEELENGDARKVDVSVRELARRELQAFERNDEVDPEIRAARPDLSAKPCEPDLRRRLRAALVD